MGDVEISQHDHGLALIELTDMGKQRSFPARRAGVQAVGPGVGDVNVDDVAVGELELDVAPLGGVLRRHGREAPGDGERLDAAQHADARAALVAAARPVAEGQRLGPADRQHLAAARVELAGHVVRRRIARGAVVLVVAVEPEAVALARARQRARRQQARAVEQRPQVAPLARVPRHPGLLQRDEVRHRVPGLLQVGARLPVLAPRLERVDVPAEEAARAAGGLGAAAAGGRELGALGRRLPFHRREEGADVGHGRAEEPGRVPSVPAVS